MDSPKKASVKHLEFQLQREKALTKELEAKCKDFHAQIARLEQEKAELRREKMQLTEETKKSSRYEDRIHFLQKEIETKDSIISQERTKAADARAEAEEIRYNANASIESWKRAEEQWIQEQSTLTDTVSQQREELTKLLNKLQTAESELADATLNLRKERDRVAKTEGARDKLEGELRLMHEKAEKLQNQLFDLEQKIYELDMAGEKQKEALCLKDTEIKTLEAEVAKHIATEEQLEQTVSSLNDRINAAKMVNLEGKGENEKLLCDLSQARKESQRLAMQTESLKREYDFSVQTQATLQKSLDELRDKLRAQQEEVKEKSVEIRKHELTISQQALHVKTLENTCGESAFRCAALEANVVQLKDQLRATQQSHEEALEEGDAVRGELNAIKTLLERKEEELVVQKAQQEEREDVFQNELRNWEKEVSQRQEVIQQLTDQLGNTNEKNAMYHGKILEESEATAKLEQEVAHLHEDIRRHNQSQLLLEAICDKKDHQLCHLAEHDNTLLALLGELRQSLHDATAVKTKQERDLLSQRGQIENLTRESQRLAADLSLAHSNAADMQEKLRSLEDAVAEKEARRVSSVQKGTNFQEENLLLGAKLASLEEQLRLCAESQTNDRVHFAGQLHSALTESDRLTSMFLERLSMADQWWEMRARQTLEWANASQNLCDEYIRALLAEKETLEGQVKELTAFADEVKLSISRKDVALAEKQEVQVAKIHSLEVQLQSVLKEKEQISFQLNALLCRFEQEQRNADQELKKTLDRVKEEERKCEATEKQCGKLRSAVEYEVKRKCEYKAAVEDLKRLREEAERNRLREKELAMEAIAKANDEARYWLTCFEKLKVLIETSRREGTRVPSIDRETLRRLDCAREQMSTTTDVPLKEHCTNLVANNTETSNIPKVKRSRVEFNQ